MDIEILLAILNICKPFENPEPCFRDKIQCVESIDDPYQAMDMCLKSRGDMEHPRYQRPRYER